MATTLKTTITDPSAAAAMLAAGGLLVPEGSAPLLSRVTVAVAVPGGGDVEVTGQAVQAAPGGGFYLHLDDPGPLREALEASAAAASAADEGEASGADEEAAGEAAGRGGRAPGERLAGAPTPSHELVDTTSEVPLYKQIAALTVNEKLRLARQASRPVRRILIRDLDKRIHLEVIKNPKCKDDEVKEYAGIGSLGPSALQWIAAQSRFKRRRDILFIVATNPATPSTTANKLLGRFTNPELLRISKSSKAREAVRRAAKKKLMQAGVL